MYINSEENKILMMYFLLYLTSFLIFSYVFCSEVLFNTQKSNPFYYLIIPIIILVTLHVFYQNPDKIDSNYLSFLIPTLSLSIGAFILSQQVTLNKRVKRAIDSQNRILCEHLCSMITECIGDISNNRLVDAYYNFKSFDGIIRKLKENKNLGFEEERLDDTSFLITQINSLLKTNKGKNISNSQELDIISKLNSITNCLN